MKLYKFLRFRHVSRLRMPHHALLTRELYLSFDCTLVFIIIIIVIVAIMLERVCSHSIKTPVNIGRCWIMAGSREPATRGCQVFCQRFDGPA